MGAFNSEFTVEGQTRSEATIPTALITVATPSLFEALRVPLRSGRIFNAADRLDSPPVLIVNQSFANRYLPGLEPLGQRVMLGQPKSGPPWATIVGVVTDYRNNGATSPVPTRNLHAGSAADRVESAVRPRAGRRIAESHAAGGSRRGAIAGSGAADLWNPVAGGSHRGVDLPAAHRGAAPFASLQPLRW